MPVSIQKQVMGLSLQDCFFFLNKGQSNKASSKQYVVSFITYPSQKKKKKRSAKFFKQSENTDKNYELQKNSGKIFTMLATEKIRPSCYST